jgi:hypothetical protein
VACHCGGTLYARGLCRSHYHRGRNAATLPRVYRSAASVLPAHDALQRAGLGPHVIAARLGISYDSLHHHLRRRKDSANA